MSNFIRGNRSESPYVDNMSSDYAHSDMNDITYGEKKKTRAPSSRPAKSVAISKNSHKKRKATESDNAREPKKLKNSHEGLNNGKATKTNTSRDTKKAAPSSAVPNKKRKANENDTIHEAKKVKVSNTKSNKKRKASDDVALTVVKKIKSSDKENSQLHEMIRKAQPSSLKAMVEEIRILTPKTVDLNTNTSKQIMNIDDSDKIMATQSTKDIDANLLQANEIAWAQKMGWPCERFITILWAVLWYWQWNRSTNGHLAKGSVGKVSSAIRNGLNCTIGSDQTFSKFYKNLVALQHQSAPGQGNNALHNEEQNNRSSQQMRNATKQQKGKQKLTQKKNTPVPEPTPDPERISDDATASEHTQVRKCCAELAQKLKEKEEEINEQDKTIESMYNQNYKLAGVELGLDYLHRDFKNQIRGIWMTIDSCVTKLLTKSPSLNFVTPNITHPLVTPHLARAFGDDIHEKLFNNPYVRDTVWCFVAILLCTYGFGAVENGDHSKRDPDSFLVQYLLNKGRDKHPLIAEYHERKAKERMSHIRPALQAFLKHEEICEDALHSCEWAIKESLIMFSKIDYCTKGLPGYEMQYPKRGDAFNKETMMAIDVRGVSQEWVPEDARVIWPLFPACYALPNFEDPLEAYMRWVDVDDRGTEHRRMTLKARVKVEGSQDASMIRAYTHW